MESCPKCKSEKLSKFGKNKMFFCFFIGGFLLAWIGIYAGILFVIGIALLTFSPAAFALDPSFKCKDCNYKFKESDIIKHRSNPNKSC